MDYEGKEDNAVLLSLQLVSVFTNVSDPDPYSVGQCIRIGDAGSGSEKKYLRIQIQTHWPWMTV